MNDDVIQNLKQFIADTVSQETSGLRVDIREDFRKEIRMLDEKLSGKIDDLLASVAEAMESSNEGTDTQLKDHKQRITRLEQKAA